MFNTSFLEDTIRISLFWFLILVLRQWHIHYPERKNKCTHGHGISPHHKKRWKRRKKSRTCTYVFSLTATIVVKFFKMQELSIESVIVSCKQNYESIWWQLFILKDFLALLITMRSRKFDTIRCMMVFTVPPLMSEHRLAWGVCPTAGAVRLGIESGGVIQCSIHRYEDYLLPPFTNWFSEEWLQFLTSIWYEVSYSRLPQGNGDFFLRRGEWCGSIAWHEVGSNRGRRWTRDWVRWRDPWSIKRYED